LRKPYWDSADLAGKHVDVALDGIQLGLERAFRCTACICIFICRFKSRKSLHQLPEFLFPLFLFLSTGIDLVTNHTLPVAQRAIVDRL
jgi:hypothetical protein